MQSLNPMCFLNCRFLLRFKFGINPILYYKMARGMCNHSSRFCLKNRCGKNPGKYCTCKQQRQRFSRRFTRGKHCKRGTCITVMKFENEFGKNAIFMGGDSRRGFMVKTTPKQMVVNDMVLKIRPVGRTRIFVAGTGDAYNIELAHGFMSSSFASQFNTPYEVAQCLKSEFYNCGASFIVAGWTKKHGAEAYFVDKKSKINVVSDYHTLGCGRRGAAAAYRDPVRGYQPICTINDAAEIVRRAVCFGAAASAGVGGTLYDEYVGGDDGVYNNLGIERNIAVRNETIYGIGPPRDVIVYDYPSDLEV
ncbi:OLC1v1015024C6 [Oldenlandia corymbosa var. corymbosa]|uniref:OLC1v1015024C6 n=1 Tax=Oldenlandia corymbosa var. corymbosa TaxID=529605 RepID=A0AAV1E307_OLDCO|nr:OLC1v1015024C6 [Oldenlandia corymbosa var. corymbosa]